MRHPEPSEPDFTPVELKDPGEKLAQVFRMTAALIESWEQSIQQQYPNADAHEVRMRRAAKHLPRHLMLAAFKWDPAEYGLVMDEEFQRKEELKARS